MSIPGSDRLSFYFAIKSSYFLNILQIWLNGTLIDTITTTLELIYPTLGINAIIFQGQDGTNDKDLALCSIQFYYVPLPSGQIATTYNALKSANSSGFLKTNDCTPTGRSLK